MTVVTTEHRSIASLELPKPASKLITYATGIVTSMTNNPSFPTPVPALATVTGAIAALQAAETAAQTWVTAPVTLQARTTIAGLTAGTTAPSSLA